MFDQSIQLLAVNVQVCQESFILSLSHRYFVQRFIVLDR